MEKNLPVPYKSQHGSDSKVSNNDCGPASLAMCLEFLGKPISTGEVLAKLGNPTGFTTIPQLAKVATDLGFNVDNKVDATFAEIKRYIDRGLPVIVVGGYGYLTSTQDKEFKGSHIMVVVGYREDDSVYVNDPNFWGEYLKDGDHHVYTGPEFFTFWRNEANKEGNQPNILFVIAPKAQEDEIVPTKIQVTAKIGLRARTTPTVNKENIIRLLPKDTELEVLEKVIGDMVDGNNNWYKVKDSPGSVFVWSGATKIIRPEGTVTVSIPEVPPKAPNVVTPDPDEYLKGIVAIYKMTRDILITNGVMLPGQPINKISFWQKIKETLRIA